MKYRVIIPDKSGTPSVYYFDEEFLAAALYRAAVLHGKPAYAFKMVKGRSIKLKEEWGMEEV